MPPWSSKMVGLGSRGPPTGVFSVGARARTQMKPRALFRVDSQGRTGHTLFRGLVNGKAPVVRATVKTWVI